MIVKFKFKARNVRRVGSLGAYRILGEPDPEKTSYHYKFEPAAYGSDGVLEIYSDEDSFPETDLGAIFEVDINRVKE